MGFPLPRRGQRRISTGDPGLPGPCENVPRRVRVGVGRMMARDAAEARLRLAVLRARVPASGAGAARVARIDEHERSTRPRELVRKLAAKLAATLVEDAPIETALGVDVCSGILASPFRTRGHINDAKVFHHDKRVVLADRRAGFVEQVAAEACDLAVEARHLRFGFAPIRGELFLTRHAALEECESLLVLLERVGAIEERAVRKRGEARHSEVDPTADADA